MRKSSRKITSAGGPIRLSPEHIAAVNRRRRIVNQFDAMDVLRLLNTDIATWMRFAFNHSDTPGNQIDSIWWDVGMMADTYPIYDSRILPRMDCPYLQKYWAKGIDWVAELVKECRERGIETFWNARNSEVDFAQPWIEGCCYTDPRCRNPLKEAHPDWVVPCWSPKGMWNLASSGLREHKVKVLRELAEKYDFDGFSLDFSRLTPCLPPGKQWRLRRHVTEYVRQVRQMLLEVARVKGRPILLAAKVPENPAGCRMDGFDVQRWIEEQLVDILVLGSRTATVAVEKFRRIAVDSPVKLVPIFDRHHTTDGYYNAPIEYLRGVYANWWAQGADSVAIFNWPCASPEDYVKQGLSTCFIPGKATYTQTIFEVGSPDTLRGKDMMFAMERRGGYPWAEGCQPQRRPASALCAGGLRRPRDTAALYLPESGG